MGFLPIEYLRRKQLGAVQQLRDLHKGCAVFLVRRGVHDDQALTVTAAQGVNA